MVAVSKKNAAAVSHFSDGFIDLVKMQSDIAEVIAERIPIKRVGSSWAGICPFHPTQTYDAFRINAQKQLYHCFNCGAAGDVIDFLMRYDKLGFAQAVEVLAQRAHLALPSNGKKPSSKALADVRPVSESLWDVAASFYQGMLWSKQGEKALAYLHSRGLSDAVLKR